MKFTALAVAIIALGIVLGLGLQGTVFEAEAKPPPPEPPAPQPVLEQNVDGSGFIAVHEQGVTDVNVTNAALPVSGTVDVGNLPAVQDVNVISAPGPVEFTHIQVRPACGPTATGFCVVGSNDVFDLNQALTSLSSQGWNLVEVVPSFFGASEHVLVYTLSRPLP